MFSVFSISGSPGKSQRISKNRQDIPQKIETWKKRKKWRISKNLAKEPDKILESIDCVWGNQNIGKSHQFWTANMKLQHCKKTSQSWSEQNMENLKDSSRIFVEIQLLLNQVNCCNKIRMGVDTSFWWRVTVEQMWPLHSQWTHFRHLNPYDIIR